MKIGFLGAGKMARALAVGLAGKKDLELLCSSRSETSGQLFLQLIPAAHWLGDNCDLVGKSDVIVVAIKPQQFPEVLPSLREISAGKLFLSLAAGVTREQIQGWLHPSARVVRAMPNTPVQVGAGASVYSGGPELSAEDVTRVEQILGAGGRAWKVAEAQINAITALSGSGPAYVFHFLDALGKAGIDLGLDPTLARELARQTVIGSARLLEKKEGAPLELAAEVKSPAGTTMAGCAVLEETGALEKLLRLTLAAAHARAEELAGKK